MKKNKITQSTVRKNTIQPPLSFTGNIRKWGLPAIMILAGLLIFTQLFRSIWFDEALTISLISRKTSITDLYFAYDIPNNHIVYSILLAKWMQFMQLFSVNSYDWMYRLFSGFIALFSIFFLYRPMIRKGGIICGSAGIFLWAISPVFLTFASGIRGYMLGTFFTIFLLYAAQKIQKTLQWRFLFIFSVTAFLAVGTAPTNLAAAVGVLIVFFPAMAIVPDKRKRLRFMLMCLIVLLAVPLFYAANFQELIGCLKLGEGWHSAPDAIWNLYSAWICVLLPMVIAAIAGFLTAWKKYPAIRWHLLCGLAILLLPLPAYILFRSAPFPRVFFPLSPVIIITLVFFARFLFCSILHKNINTGKQLLNKTARYFVLFCMLWGFFTVRYAGNISGFLYGHCTSDDLVQPYYMHPAFDPNKMIALLQQQLVMHPDAKVFLSFRADYPALLYAALSAGIPEDKLCFDPPNQVQYVLPEQRNQSTAIEQPGSLRRACLRKHRKPAAHLEASVLNWRPECRFSFAALLS